MLVASLHLPVHDDAYEQMAKIKCWSVGESELASKPPACPQQTPSKPPAGGMGEGRGKHRGWGGRWRLSPLGWKVR